MKISVRARTRDDITVQIMVLATPWRILKGRCWGPIKNPPKVGLRPQVRETFTRENKLAFCLHGFIHFETHITHFVVIAVKTYSPLQLNIGPFEFPVRVCLFTHPIPSHGHS